MKRCKSTTKSGNRCLNWCRSGGEFCKTHSNNVSTEEAIAISTGALLGNAILPGIGGLIFGGILGKLGQSVLGNKKISKTHVFVSFDFDNDRILKDFLLGQAKLEESPFEVVDYSLHEAAPEREWEEKARIAISRADIVLVIVGAYTYKAQGVLKEISMAREAGVKVVQIIGYKDGNFNPVPNAGRLYKWNWQNLKNLLS